jgi:hypothetical protein
VQLVEPGVESRELGLCRFDDLWIVRVTLRRVLQLLHAPLNAPYLFTKHLGDLRPHALPPDALTLRSGKLTVFGRRETGTQLGKLRFCPCPRAWRRRLVFARVNARNLLVQKLGKAVFHAALTQKGCGRSYRARFFPSLCRRTLTIIRAGAR